MGRRSLLLGLVRRELACFPFVPLVMRSSDGVSGGLHEDHDLVFVDRENREASMSHALRGSSRRLAPSIGYSDQPLP